MTTQLAERTLEAHLLGAILIDPTVLDIALEELHPKDLGGDAYRAIYEAMISLDREGVAIDPITLQSRLPKYGAMIEEIVGAASSAANASWYVREIRRAAIRRRTAHVLDAYGRLIGDTSKNPLETVDRLAGAVLDIAMEGSKEAQESMTHVAQRVIKEADTRRHSASHIIGITTHLPRFNKLLSGLQPAKSYILAGYPGMGKTALALNIVRYVAMGGRKVMMFSLEMSREEVAQRLIAAEAQVDAMKTFEGSLDAVGWDRARGAVDTMADWLERVIVDDRSNLSPIQMLARSRREKRSGGLDLVVVDYLQLMTHHDKEVRSSEYRTATECSKAMKALSKSLRAPVLTLSQLRRPGANERNAERSLPEPTNDMLRSSGQIEADADVVAFIHKEHLWLGKNRGGPLGHKIELVFRKECLLFHEKAEREEDEGWLTQGPRKQAESSESELPW